MSDARRGGRQTRSGRAAHERGFTLIEMIVVVAVLGVLAGVAGMTRGHSATSMLELSELTIKDAMHHAQSLARSTRLPHGVVFDPDNDRYTIVDVNGEQAIDPLTRRAFVVNLTGPGQPPGVRLELADFGDCGVALVFDAQGVPLTGGHVTLLCGGLRRSVFCDAATGEVSSQDG